MTFLDTKTGWYRTLRVTEMHLLVRSGKCVNESFPRRFICRWDIYDGVPLLQDWGCGLKTYIFFLSSFQYTLNLW